MDKTLLKKELSGLLSMTDNLPRLKEEMEKILDSLQCKHESDGMVYTSMPPQYRCKKCGEFYR